MNDSPEQPNASPVDDENLDGFTIAELSDYLDRGRTPRDASIEASPAAQNALAALSRLRTVAPRIIDADATTFAARDENWITRILDQIGVQARAGRDIPIPHDVPGARLAITEGAVRALVREAGDETDGLIVERTHLDGELERAHAQVDVQVVVSIFADAEKAPVIAEFQERVRRALETHTDLSLRRVTVRVHDDDITDAEAERKRE
jgi:uncharacterized alkaline shock family protein YloU